VPACVAACRQTDSGSAKNRELQLQAVWHRHRLLLGTDHHFTKGTLHVRKTHRAAEESHVQAMTRLAFQAIQALSTGSAGIDHDPVARLDPLHRGTGQHDLTGDLVARDQRLPQTNGAETAMLIVVQVRTADTAGPYAHLNVERTQRRNIGIPDAEIVCSVDDGGFHVCLLDAGSVSKRSG
jgi:hypothetical protein